MAFQRKYAPLVANAVTAMSDGNDNAIKCFSKC